MHLTEQHGASSIELQACSMQCSAGAVHPDTLHMTHHAAYNTPNAVQGLSCPSRYPTHDAPSAYNTPYAVQGLSCPSRYPTHDAPSAYNTPYAVQGLSCPSRYTTHDAPSTYDTPNAVQGLSCPSRYLHMTHHQRITHRMQCRA
jgi:hypothetical protein